VKLLIIEDEHKIADSLRKGFEELHFQVDVAHDGNSGLRMASQDGYQVIILDRMLPQLDGLDVLEKLRQQGLRTPVLLLSALDRVHDRISGLQAGADDYLVKPFAFGEVLARIQAILRRTNVSVPQDTVQFEDLTLRYSTQTVHRGGKMLELTPKEFRILCLLVEGAGNLVTRKELLQKVWGLNFDCETNVVDVAVRRLRQKLDDPYQRKLIRTVRGAGYQLDSQATSDR